MNAECAVVEDKLDLDNAQNTLTLVKRPYLKDVEHVGLDHVLRDGGFFGII